MVSLFNSPLFDGLEADVAQRLTYEYFKLYEQHKSFLDPETDDFLQTAHLKLGLSPLEPWSLVGLPAVRMALKRQIEKYPIPCLLQTLLNDRQELEGTFNSLKFWTVAASIALLSIDQEEQSRIKKACAAVRLMAKSRDHHLIRLFEGHTTSAKDIHNKADKEERDAQKRDAEQRFAPIRVLMLGFIQRSQPRRHAVNHKAELRVHKTKTHIVTDREKPYELDGDIKIAKTIAVTKTSEFTFNPEQEVGQIEVHVKPMGSTQELQIRPLQHLRKSALFFDVQMRKAAISTIIGSPTAHETRCLAKAFQQNASLDDERVENPKAWQAEVIIFTAILLSMRPKKLMSLLEKIHKTERNEKTGIWFEYLDGSLYFCRRIKLSNFGLSKAAQKHCKETPKPMRVALPSALSTAIIEIVKTSNKDIFSKELINDTIDKMFIEERRKIKLQVLLPSMHIELTRAGQDAALIAYLTGESEKSQTSLYYLTLDNRDIELAFRNASCAIFGNNIKWPSEPLSHAVGSSINLKEISVKRLFKYTDDELRRLSRDNLEDQFWFHNRYICLVATALNMMTGHRPVRAPFERISDYDRRKRIVFICDKDNKRSRRGRFIAVPDLFDEQIRYYLHYLEGLESSYLAKFPDVVASARAARNGEGPLLFYIHKVNTASNIEQPFTLETRTLTPSYMAENITNKLWPFPLNWPRHFMRDCFFGLSSEHTHALLGHSHIGFEPLAQHSGTSFIEQANAIRSQLNTLCADQGILAFRGS